MNKEEKKFKKEYLDEKLHLIGERLNDAYGQPLLEELIARMERTVSHFNEEVDDILVNIKSRTQNQHYKLATLRGDDPIKNAINEDESQLNVSSDSDNDINVKNEEPKDEQKKSKFSFLKRKKKK
ncbi:MAG: hypothetical protein ACJZ15_03460 [Candidatus Neomarinimicrobiota bacterium]|nr:MAG: hypothetical protein CBC68_02735 [Candidatus Marinimicrobia bacterium TMED108]RCL89319.1 MAG: hypothetical protein DBW60_04130 [bacterium]|tara:strand:- start:1235 stop:1609 length:375 start_codon:yes stop_codon:yes gene_type:complete